MQPLLGEGSSAFLKGKFEPFSRYLAMGHTWRCPQLPHRARLPLLCVLCQGRPRPCSSRASRACVFFRISCLITGSSYMFFDSPVRDITLDLAIHNCIYRMRASGACQDFSSRSGERFQSIRPPSCPLAWLAPGWAACREDAGGGRCNVHQ